MDPELATKTTRQIQHDLAAAQATIATRNADRQRPAPLTADDIAAALDHAGDLAGLLADSEREKRARLYRTLDLVLQLDPVQETLEARLQLCGWWRGLDIRVNYNPHTALSRTFAADSTSEDPPTDRSSQLGGSHVSNGGAAGQEPALVHRRVQG